MFVVVAIFQRAKFEAKQDPLFELGNASVVI